MTQTQSRQRKKMLRGTGFYTLSLIIGFVVILVVCLAVWTLASSYSQ